MFITPSLLLVALSVYIAIILIPAILFTKAFQKALKEMSKDTNLIRISALIGMIVSFLFLSVHWKFTGGWFMLIPIIGWAAFIKSVIGLWFPNLAYKMAQKTYLKSETTAGLIAFVGLLMAIFFTYIALYIY